MITREEIRKEYEQLTCKQVHLLSLNDGEIFTYMYVNWLEDNLLNQINKRHKQDSLHDAAMAAWMAARNRYSGVVGGCCFKHSWRAAMPPSSRRISSLMTRIFSANSLPITLACFCFSW